MTDKEKLAEEYVKSVIDVNAFDWKVVREIALAHIAGQKAGGPKWHKVADGDLPKDEDYKWCISSNGVYYVARYEELFVSWTNQEHKEVCCPIAWCEIPQYTEG